MQKQKPLVTVCTVTRGFVCSDDIHTGMTGLEPATSALTGQRSNQLSYTPRLFLPERSRIYPNKLSAVKRPRNLFAEFLAKVPHGVERRLPGTDAEVSRGRSGQSGAGSV